MDDISIFKTFGMVLRTIKIILQRSKINFFVASVIFIFNSIASFIQLVIFSRIINIIVLDIQTKGQILDIKTFYTPLLSLFALFLIPIITSNISESINTKIRENLQTDLEILRATRFSNLDIASVESTPFQTKLQRASDWGVGAIRNMYGFYQTILATMSALIFAGILLIRIDYRLAVLAVLSVIPGYFIDTTFSLKLFQLRYMTTDDRRIALNRISFFLSPRSLVDLIQNKT